MRELLTYLDARLGEPSTYAGIAVLLGLMHVNVPAGVMQSASLWGAVIAGAMSMLLQEMGKKPGMQVADDVLGALVSGIKAMPAPAPAPVVPTPPAPAPVVKAAA